MAISEEQQGLLMALARIALAAIFLHSGFGKLMNLDGFVASLTSKGVPLASVLGVVGAAVEFFGGLAILLGAWTRAAAALMALFTVVATAISHRFWDYPEAAQAMQQTQLMKNLAIIGGFLSLLANGGGRYAMDSFRRDRSG